MSRSHRLRNAALLTSAGLFLALCVMIWQRSTFIDPRPTSILSDRSGNFMAQVGDEGRGYGYWPVPVVPQRVSIAILALEDKRFWEHPGVDPLAVLRAVRSNLTRARRISGASTLAMQVARMQHPEARGYFAKLTEMATAVTMTARYGREAVMRQYLRLVPFGQNSHGIAHAARWYFDKPPEDLSWAEIAFLSAIPQAPGAMNPETEIGRLRAVERGRQALDRLRRDGVMTDGDYRQSLDEIDALSPQRHPTRPSDALHAVLLTELLLAGQKPVEQVRSTIDLDIQKRVTKLARLRLDALRGEGAQQMAVMVVDARSAQVLALVGSGRYGSADSGMIDYALCPRSPGSTLKPFIYAQALERGDIASDTVLIDDPDNGTGIENADRRFLGPLLPRQALGNSRNVPAAKLVRLSGLDRTYWFLANLGLHNNIRPAERYGLTLAVGGLPTRLDWLVGAYQALSDDGVQRPLQWYLGEPLPLPRRVLRAQTARLITSFLADPMARLPSFSRMSAVEYPFPVAIKTGTSQGYRDAWVVAYSQRYLVGVWMGRPDGRPMDGLSGATSAALLAHDVLLDLHRQEDDGQDDGEFSAPQGLRQAAVCAETGSLDPGHCDRVLTEFVPPAAPAAAMSLAASIVSAPTVHLQIATPNNHAVFIRNPEMPVNLDFLPFRLRAGAGIAKVVWYIDGKPYQLAGSADTVQWPVAAGRHWVSVQSPFGEVRSRPVEFEVM